VDQLIVVQPDDVALAARVVEHRRHTILHSAARKRERPAPAIAVPSVAIEDAVALGVEVRVPRQDDETMVAARAEEALPSPSISDRL